MKLRKRFEKFVIGLILVLIVSLVTVAIVAQLQKPYFLNTVVLQTNSAYYLVYALPDKSHNSLNSYKSAKVDKSTKKIQEEVNTECENFKPNVQDYLTTSRCNQNELIYYLYDMQTDKATPYSYAEAKEWIVETGYNSPDGYVYYESYSEPNYEGYWGPFYFFFLRELYDTGEYKSHVINKDRKFKEISPLQTPPTELEYNITQLGWVKK